MKPVTIKLPPDCEQWMYWIDLIRELDGKQVIPKRKDSVGDFLVPIRNVAVYVKGEWCHEESACQWLPWDPTLPEGQYLITGGTWECDGYGQFPMKFKALCYYKKGVFRDEETENTYFPTHYLANIPEVPQ